MTSGEALFPGLNPGTVAFIPTAESFGGVAEIAHRFKVLVELWSLAVDA